jgi:hypothetical protein
MAGELKTAARKIKTLPQQMVRAGANTIKTPLQAAYARDAGGDGVLSGVRNMPRFRATTSVRGTSDVRGKVGIRPAGPATWLNDGARRRIVGRTRAKHTFDRVVDTELPQAQRVMERMFDNAVR